eukprot:4092534-Pyramimonas_sp.AAC.1
MKENALELMATHCRHFRIKACWYDKKMMQAPDRFKLPIMLGVPQQANKWEGCQHALMEALQLTLLAAGGKDKKTAVTYLP